MLVQRRMKGFFYVQITILLVGVYILFSWYRSGGSFPSLRKKRTPPPKYTVSIDYRCADITSPHHDLVPGIRFLLYIISHDNASHEIAMQWSHCKPWARVVRVPTTPFFESIVYRDILPSHIDEWKDIEFVGITTYRSLKFSPLEKIAAYLELAHHKPYDIVPLYTTGELLMKQAVQGHTLAFQERWDDLLLKLNYDRQVIRQYDDIEVFLRNSMVLRPQWLLPLMNFMSIAINAVEQDPYLKALFATDANYREAIYRKQTAQKVFHTPYYQWHPFIFERLPAFYFAAHNASVYGVKYQLQHFDFPDSTLLFKGL